MNQTLWLLSIHMLQLYMEIRKYLTRLINSVKPTNNPLQACDSFLTSYKFNPSMEK